MTYPGSRNHRFPTARLPLLAAAFAASALVLAAPLPAQDIGASSLPEELFHGQAPVTEADVPAALELLRANPENSTAETFYGVGQRHGLDPRRTDYVAVKFLTGVLALTAGMTRDQVAMQFGTPLAYPTDGELEVVRGNLPAIKSALGLE
ncbi:MAG: hypothetical protein LBG06_08530 [Deltaproteobacteria bacterium]|jgi:hypothetical protein|nr:hypothetical protein [Deltaproteobacteria bacterium]